MGEENNFGAKLVAVAITLLIVALVLGIGADITDSMKNKYVNSTFTTNQADNESWTPANGSTFLLANPDRVESTSIVVRNASELIPATNYTLVVTTPATIKLTGPGYNGTNLNISYSYKTVARTIAEEPFANGTESMAELSSWLPTIALVIAASFIIGLIVLFFRRRI